MNSHRFHTIFFDVGGTLIGAPNIFELLAERLDPQRKQELADFILARFKEHYNPDAPFLEVREIFSRVMKKASIEFTVRDLSAEAASIYRKTFVDNAWLFPDTLSTLETLKKKGKRLIVLSDADAPVLMEELVLLKLDTYFEHFIISSQLRAYKPSEKIVKAALKLCEGPLSRVMLVGDSHVDVLTAKKMSITSVLIAKKGGPTHDADFVISELNELLSLS